MAAKIVVGGGQLYGLQWGDPETVEPLKFVRDRYVLPYVKGDQVAAEIGPGGGRWTRYLLGFRTLYLIDYYSDLQDELKRNLKGKNLRFIKNNGTDFPGITQDSLDYIFSFGCFVHLEMPLIQSYLNNMYPVLRPGGNAVIQYSDMTKIMGKIEKGFSKNSPEQMRRVVVDAGFKIVEEDLTTLWHSSILRFTR